MKRLDSVSLSFKFQRQRKSRTRDKFLDAALTDLRQLRRTSPVRLSLDHLASGIHKSQRSQASYRQQTLIVSTTSLLHMALDEALSSRDDSRYSRRARESGLPRDTTMYLSSLPTDGWMLQGRAPVLR